MGRRGRGRGRHARAPRPAARRFAVADETMALGSAEGGRPAGWPAGAELRAEAQAAQEPAPRRGDGAPAGLGSHRVGLEPVRSSSVGSEERDRSGFELEAEPVTSGDGRAPRQGRDAPVLPDGGRPPSPGGASALRPEATVGRQGEGRAAPSDDGSAATTPAEPEGPTRTRSAGRTASCSPSQLRRFIKSRPYVPLHEVRRRFGIDGAEDEVARIEIDGRGLFVGLPRREAEMLQELIRAGDVGVELLLDPESPVVVGVYPTRPVVRK